MLTALVVFQVEFALILNFSVGESKRGKLYFKICLIGRQLQLPFVIFRSL